MPPDTAFRVAFARIPQDTASSSPHQRLARDIFQELVGINTTVTKGCGKAAGAMAARFRAAGFPSNDIHLVGPAEEHKNLVVRYRGKGMLRPVLFIGHLDVVEAHQEDWTINPFTLTERDGYFYGRGTTDMKNEDADLVANFIRMKQEGYVPERTMILALTEDEEAGDANGVYWLLTHHRDLIDAEFCINPDVGGGDIRRGRRIALELQTSEKIYISYQLEVKNPGGHSSLPVRDNAIYRLAAGLSRLAEFDFPIHVNETTRTFFERTSATETGQMKLDMMAILATPLDTAAAGRLAAASPYYNAMLRTTCVATMLSGGHAENALPQRARATINCRMLPDDLPANVAATLHRVLADSQIVITRLNEPSPGPPSPLRNDVLHPIEHLTAAMWPGVIVTPVMSTGASDGKSLRRAGIPVYGVSGMFGDIDDVRAHGKDERIGTREFYDGVEFMYRLMHALSSGL